jgi:hypothetical protein
MGYTFKEILRIVIIVLFFLFIFTYGFFRAKDVIFGVKIRDVNIVDGTKYTENPVTIEGNARNAIHLLLNGREIFIDSDGNFRETIALLSGYNIIEIYAKDKFGKEDIKHYKLTYEKVFSLEDSIKEIEQDMPEEIILEENIVQEEILKSDLEINN